LENSLTYFLSATRPYHNIFLKYLNMSESFPPISSTYSNVSLNGAYSKFIPPGLIDKMKP